MAKSKNRLPAKPAAAKHGGRRQLDSARQAHAKGLIGTEDYIWAAMQCYAAEIRAARG